MPIEVLDITSEYLRHVPHQREQDYFAAYPALFRHYYRYWATPGDLVRLDDRAVRAKTALIRGHLPVLEQRLTRSGLTDRVLVVLFVGANTTNGHAFWDQDRRAFVVWLPVEAYATPLQVAVFVTHEVVHALHYTRHPAFFFHEARGRHEVGRQVMTEGLATWATQALMDFDDVTALWADYVTLQFAQRWYARCRAQERTLAQRILDEWHASPADNAWFSLWDEHDVARYRGGYCLGLRALQKVARDFAPAWPTLLALPKPALEARVRQALRDMAAGRG